MSAGFDLDRTWDVRAPVQPDIDAALPGDGLELSGGVGQGTMVVRTRLDLLGQGADATTLLGGDGPALVIDAPGQHVTVTGLTLATSGYYGTVVVRAGTLEIDGCVVAGPVGIVAGPGAGDLTISDTRVVCPRGGCGVAALGASPVWLDRVTVSVNDGLAVLGRSGAIAGIDDVEAVGDHIARHLDVGHPVGRG